MLCLYLLWFSVPKGWQITALFPQSFLLILTYVHFQLLLVHHLKRTSLFPQIVFILLCTISQRSCALCFSFYWQSRFQIWTMPHSTHNSLFNSPTPFHIIIWYKKFVFIGPFPIFNVLFIWCYFHIMLLWIYSVSHNCYNQCNLFYLNVYLICLLSNKNYFSIFI